MISRTDIQENLKLKEKSSNKKRIQQLKRYQFQLKQRVKTLKNYDTWRQTKLLRISDDHMKKIEQQPLLSIAFDCGYKNNVNEVLQDLFQQRSNKKVGEKPDYVNQKSDQPFEKTQKKYKKRFSFVQYKNTKEQLHKINRNISPSYSKKREKTEEQSNSPKTAIYLDKTPRQIKQLRYAMKTLPILTHKERQQRNSTNNHRYSTLQRFQPASTQNKFETRRDSFQIKKSPQNEIKVNSKTLFLRQKVSQILSTADLLLQQQFKKGSKDEMSVQEKAKSVEKRSSTADYWPSYKQYSISTQDKANFNQVKSNYKDVFEDGFEFQDYVLQLVRNLKKDFLQIEKKDEMSIIQAFKNAFQTRFNYRISIERQKYRRNVKSYLKCILDHRNQTKRQEVKANGIRRFKRQSLMQKIQRLVPQKQEDQQY